LTVLTDVLLLGQQKQGSYALSYTKSKMFYQSLISLLDNGHGKAEPVNLKMLGNFLGRLTEIGMVLDDRLENHLRGIADMPLRDAQQPSLRKSRPAFALKWQ
jgi:hypothetical protein